MQSGPVVAWAGSLLVGLALARAVTEVSVNRIRSAGFEMLWRGEARSARVARGELLEIEAEVRNRDSRAARFVGLRAVFAPELSTVIVPGQRLALPAGAAQQPNGGGTGATATADAVRASLDRWSAAYGVDPRLARATAWMESGFQQSVVSNVGAVGVMQLLPGTWAWVDQILLGTTTPRTYAGNVRAGVRYLRWLLDQFNGDRRLALAGYYQGAQAVRDRGLFEDTKRYVAIILKLYGTV